MRASVIDRISLDPSAADDMVSTLTTFREDVMQRATTLLRAPDALPFVEQFDALPTMSALLVSSLEELKVAEEELHQQNTVLLTQRADVDARVTHYRQLFLHAPMPAFVTDIFGTIHEVNLAAAHLFRREANHLDGKPLQALLPTETREPFRRQLARLPVETGVADWHMVLQRVGDVPLRVSASVHFVPGVGRTGAGALYWMLRVIDPSD
ncbi:MAG: sensor signal transduction histidine kinase [Gemmatimonadetes bacterium]|nr:sensor signal transduction histidine kinase [Gemmatimonadota bacterium]